MAVEIAGQTTGAERQAAESLKSRLEPALRPQDRVVIIAGAKCYGQKTEDIDLLVIGQFTPPFGLPEEIRSPNTPAVPVHVSNFVMIIEVKDHDSAAIRFEGNQVRTRYAGRWHDASGQVFKQVFALKEYLRQILRIDVPHIFKALWLRNVPRDSIPQGTSQVLPADLSPLDFFRVLLEQNPGHAAATHEGGILVASSAPARRTPLSEIVEFFTKQLQPGVLDRKRLDILSTKHLKGQQYVDNLGAQALIFRGRGGAGKTLRLLSIGNQVRREKGSRVLLLTYNLALVADIRRLLAMVGAGGQGDSGTIQVRSRDSYLLALLKACGLPARNASEPFADYDANKQRLIELWGETTTAALQQGALAADKPELFAWDFILVDEGQDWPEVDRDILLKAFGAERLIIADGVDQFVSRQPKRCAWDIAQPRQIVSLHRSLRLKANLCRFAARFASDSGLEWDMEPNDDVAGGRIRIVLGEYMGLHKAVMDQHLAQGNNPIDALFCVTGSNDARYRNFPQMLQATGARIWDGTKQETRQDYPRELAQHRIVKYESCRGLEGWTVACLDLDAFFARKLKEGRNLQTGDLFDSPETVALRHAARWCLIPFTRAIDTLVLQLDKNSALWKRLEPIALDYRDFVEIIG